MHPHLVMDAEPVTESLKQEILTGFSQHAIEMTGYDDKKESVAFVARIGDEMVGAVTAELFWGALHIKYVFVKKKWRGRRIASQLMERALRYAKEQTCPFAFVETMSFQALPFYQKLGFVLEFTQTGFSHGTSFHYLKKMLT